MIIKGLRKSENDETNKEDGLNIILAITKEAGIDKSDFRKHLNKIHPIGGAKKWKLSKNYKIYYT